MSSARLISAEIMNWTGKVVIAPRSQLPKLANAKRRSVPAYTSSSETTPKCPPKSEFTTQQVQEYETLPPGRAGDNPLGLYRPTPDRIRECTPEEIDKLVVQRERERAKRFRWIYGKTSCQMFRPVS